MILTFIDTFAEGSIHVLNLKKNGRTKELSKPAMFCDNVQSACASDNLDSRACRP